MTLSQHRARPLVCSASCGATNSTARNLIELAVGEFDRVGGLRVRCDAVAGDASTALVFAGTLGIVAGPAAEEGAISIGSFIAFQADFAGFVAGLLDVVRAGEAVIAAPSWERLRPIPLAEQETGLGRPAVGPLRLAARQLA